MMHKASTMLFILVVTGGVSYACVNPADGRAAGVQWDNGETVNLSAIMTMGTMDTNYLKQGAAYYFRSHYAPEAMVYLTRERMAVITDSIKTAKGFDYAEAVRVECDWLISASVIDMAKEMCQKIKEGIHDFGDSDAVYWTKYNKTVPFSCTVTGEKYDYRISCALYTDGVCGLDVEFKIPPEQLGSKTAVLLAPKGKSIPRVFIAGPGSGSFVHERIPGAYSQPANLHFVDLRGRQLNAVIVQAKARSLFNYKVCWYALFDNRSSSR
jgi:hypothetical protein